LRSASQRNSEFADITHVSMTIGGQWYTRSAVQNQRTECFVLFVPASG
jgi:hypothetical protein